jgi:hypothetical protein
VENRVAPVFSRKTELSSVVPVMALVPTKVFAVSVIFALNKSAPCVATIPVGNNAPLMVTVAVCCATFNSPSGILTSASCVLTRLKFSSTPYPYTFRPWALVSRLVLFNEKLPLRE